MVFVNPYPSAGWCGQRKITFFKELLYTSVIFKGSFREIKVEKATQGMCNLGRKRRVFLF